MRSLLLVLALGLALPLPLATAGAPATAGTPSVDELLRRLDANMTFDTRSSKLTMTVTKGGRTKVYTMQSYGRGADDAAMEFLSPDRDAGTRMLKKGDELWMYLPSVEKTQRISGHMLRQGMMGSDFSYEDMLESAALRTLYTSTITGEEVKDGVACYRLEMIANQPEVSYPKRIMWMDKQNLVPVHQELYAVSGMMLKEIVFSNVKTFGDRQFPTKIVATDKLQTGSSTVVTFDELTFSVKLEEEVFSMRWLER